MKYQILAALMCCTVAGLALAESAPPKKAVAPSSKTIPASAQKSSLKTAPKVASKSVSKTGAAKGPSTGKPLTAHTTQHSATGSKTGTPAVTRNTTTARNRYASYRRPPVRRSTQQATPTSDRFREIQDALATQGYLKTPSTGVWDKDSIDAMQRFQKDKNLEPTGKLTARSLSALGLGPKPVETSMLPAANPPASLSANPGNEAPPLQ